MDSTRGSPAPGARDSRGQTPGPGLMPTAPSPGEPAAHSTPAHTSSLRREREGKDLDTSSGPHSSLWGPWQGQARSEGQHRVQVDTSRSCLNTPAPRGVVLKMWGCALWCRSVPVPCRSLQHHQPPGTDPSCPPGTAWQGWQLGVSGQCGSDEPLHWAGRGERALEAHHPPQHPLTSPGSGQSPDCSAAA